MNEIGFKGYVGDPNIHDGTITKIKHEGDEVRVILKDGSGKVITVDFIEVKSIRSNRPDAMILYSLTEMKNEPPFRLFVFVNWEERDDAFFEILAKDFSVLK